MTEGLVAKSLHTDKKFPPSAFFYDASTRFQVMTFPEGGFMVTLIGHATISRIPLDERSAQRRDLYQANHNNHTTQISMPPAGFEITTPTRELLSDPCLGLALVKT